MIFEELCSEIEKEYIQLGHKLGWRFLTGPRKPFDYGANIGLITLNPGGNEEIKEHPKKSSEVGSAYFHEIWPGHKKGESPLQRQIQHMFKMIHESIKGTGSPEELANNTLAGHFIPFRSPSFKDLVEPVRSVEFGRKLWSIILKRWTPKVIICMDQKTFPHLKEILCEIKGSAISDSLYPTGWGKINAGIVRFKDGTMILRFPHLSRFKIFNRSASEEFVSRIIHEITDRSPY